MNSLERYIGDLNPSCWLNSEHVNGFGVAQPSVDSNITQWTDISGNGVHAKQNFFITSSPVQFKVNPNNIPFIYTNGTKDNALHIDLRSVAAVGQDYTEIFILGTNAPFENNNNKVSIGQSSITKGGFGNGYLKDVPNNLTYTSGIGYEAAPNIYLTNGIFNGATRIKYSTCINSVKVSNYQKVYDHNVNLYSFNSSGITSRYFYSNGGGQGYLIGLGACLDQPSNVNPYEDGNLTTFSSGVSVFYEYILFNKAITPLEIKQVQSYIKQKYNI